MELPSDILVHVLQANSGIGVGTVPVPSGDHRTGSSREGTGVLSSTTKKPGGLRPVTALLTIPTKRYEGLSQLRGSRKSLSQTLLLWALFSFTFVIFQVLSNLLWLSAWLLMLAKTHMGIALVVTSGDLPHLTRLPVLCYKGHNLFCQASSPAL